MTGNDNHRPVLIELDGEASHPNPSEAPPVAEPDFAPTSQAMQIVATMAVRPRSVLAVWFWRLLGAVVVFFASITTWDFLTGLTERNQLLGTVACVLLGLFAVVCLGILIRELAAFSRLRKVEKLHNEAAKVAADNDIECAKVLVRRLTDFYSGREDTRWGRERLSEALANTFDADTLLFQAEDTLLIPLDTQAIREVETASRQVAMVTALIPLAFADVLAVLTSNLRMIRRIAEIYGGHSGTLGAWRLTRAVITHLVATGAVAVGDDLISSIGGGHLLGKLSRRFGEGLVNGALTARVGIAAMEVCRPLPFGKDKRPRVATLVRRALTGLFDRAG